MHTLTSPAASAAPRFIGAMADALQRAGRRIADAYRHRAALGALEADLDRMVDAPTLDEHMLRDIGLAHWMVHEVEARRASRRLAEMPLGVGGARLGGW